MTDNAPNRFGFLSDPFNTSFAGVTITPLPDHADRLRYYLSASNTDGFIYPPEVATYTKTKKGDKWRKLPLTSRPAPVYRLPASHFIEVAHPLSLVFPHSDATLLVQLLAFIFGTRLQFEEWRFDGRVPVKPALSVSISNPERLHFVEHAYVWWRSLPPKLRPTPINLLHAYNRAVSSEWEWDAFHQQYAVFDGLFRFHADLHQLTGKISHKQRFYVLCEAYEIPFNEELVGKIHRVRNELVHEALWAGTLIGHRDPNHEASDFHRHLARLNARILCAITGYQNTFTSSTWWAKGQFPFGAPQSISLSLVAPQTEPR